jgi:hypothetical protein
MKMVVATIIGVLLVCVGVLAGFLFALETSQSNNSSTLPEYVTITNVEYGIGPNGWIAVTVNNTGIGPVTIAKVLVNTIKQSSINPSLPTAVAADNGVVLNVSMNVVQSEIYDIDLLTSKGNKFSESSQAFPVPTPTEQQASIRLYKANVGFVLPAQNKINIDVGNYGTTDTQIIQVYIGTSDTTLQNQTIPSLPIACPAGGVASITVNYNWTGGATYYFKVISSSGQYLEWPEQSPASLTP